MKIQSRLESKDRKFPYRDHENTPIYMPDLSLSKGIQLVSAYIPTSTCPPDAEPSYFLAFGCKGRRVVIELNHEEASLLSRQLGEAVAAQKLRQIK